MAQENLREALGLMREALPATAAAADAGELVVGPENAASKLGRVAMKGLEVLDEVVNRPLDWDEPKQVRIICDMAVAANKLLMRAAEGEYRARREDGLTRLLELLAENERKALASSQLSAAIEAPTET